MQNDPEPGKLRWQDTPDEQDSLAKRKINCHGTIGLQRRQIHRRPRHCPVSLKMRHGERHYLRCLKYVRQSAPSIVSPIMRQVCKSSALSYQVSGSGASFR